MKKTFSTLGLLLLASIAHAHETTAGGGFVAGLYHPVLGSDHLLAMLSVGILSMQMGGRAIWTVPTTFVVVMILGGVAGIYGLPLFSVELGIALSVLALGLAIAISTKMLTWAGMVFVGFFAVFHGHAHGTEMPQIAKPALYALGFATGTAGIHIAGVLVGVVGEKVNQGRQFLRYVGAGIAGIGFYLIFLT